MEIFGSDVIIGDFRASDFGLVLGAVDYDGSSEDEMGNDITIAEQFIGRNPVPVYLDYSYTEKLKPTITLVRTNCGHLANTPLSEYEIRSILRLITGTVGYKWMKVVTDEISEDTWYRAKVINTALVRVAGIVVGLKIFMECDSQFGYSPIQHADKSVSAYEPFRIFNNSDDIYTYLLPNLKIIMAESGNLEITNNSEPWKTIINNVSNGEIIEINSEKEILTSSISHPNVLLNDFNLHWIRMVNGINEYVTNLNCEMQFSFRLRRKGGFICR